ncbi:ecdysoneless-like protein [Drosera capensis]
MVSLAVEGFYDRDVDTMRYAARMERFGVRTGDEMVIVGVRMSRVMYAQLMMQRFQGPKGYPMVTKAGGHGVAFKEAELGMKIACGFEMTYQLRKKEGEEGRRKERKGRGRRGRRLRRAWRGMDDDSWLYSGEDELNAALMERQQEMDLYEQTKRSKKKGKKRDDEKTSSCRVTNNFDPVDIARSVQAFVKKVSSYQGAEVPENRNGVCIGPLEKEDPESDDIDEGSSLDMDSDESDEGMDDVANWEEDDKGGDKSFLNTYSDVLNKELNTTTLKKSFIRANDLSDNKEEGTSGAMDEDMDEEFTPVDVDVNLVQNILDSFYSQQGLPGPVSNLLGLMGVELPRDTNKDK